MNTFPEQPGRVGSGASGLGLNNSLNSPSNAPGPGSSGSVQSLSQLWAKKYVERLSEQEGRSTVANVRTIADRLKQGLRSISVQAWSRTEALLAEEVVRHQIDFELIDPWEITRDAHGVFEKALNAYAEALPPPRLSTRISSDLGQIRQKHTAVDPRVIGFISMQFHYIGTCLLETLPPAQQPALRDYFKVVDDHLYMPLHRAYGAAANHHPQSPTLRAVQTLLPHSSAIARRIVARVLNSYANYRCLTGSLQEPVIQTSSIRDVEMFQVYLWVCVLEGNISAIQHELFPLCVMLYPKLKVSWELVRQLIHLMGSEIRATLSAEQAIHFTPYYQALWLMFSPEVFPETV